MNAWRPARDQERINALPNVEDQPDRGETAQNNPLPDYQRRGVGNGFGIRVNSGTNRYSRQTPHDIDQKNAVGSPMEPRNIPTPAPLTETPIP